MIKKEKIAITLDKNILTQIDSKIDKVNFKNRSHVIETMLREGLKLKDGIGSIILAHENNWDNNEYPFDYPKCLISIEGKTLLEKHVENLMVAGIKKCVIFYSNDQVLQYISDKKYDIEIIYEKVSHDCESLYLTQKGKQILSTNTLLVILADNYFYDFHLLDFLYYHNIGKQGLSMAVKTIESSQGYGNIKLEGNNIVGFVERPQTKADISFIVNTGIYLINSEILPEGNENLKLETHFFPQYVGRQKAKAYFHNGYWFHVQSNKVLQEFGLIK